MFGIGPLQADLFVTSKLFVVYASDVSNFENTQVKNNLFCKFLLKNLPSFLFTWVVWSKVTKINKLSKQIQIIHLAYELPSIETAK